MSGSDMGYIFLAAATDQQQKATYEAATYAEPVPQFYEWILGLRP